MEKHGCEAGVGGGRIPGRGAGVFYSRPNAPERQTRFPDGFTGTLALKNPDRLNEAATGTVLQRLHALESWRYAQQARTLHRLYEHIQDACIRTEVVDAAGATGSAQPPSENAHVFSLTATEVQTLLCISYQAAARMLADALDLCSGFPATLAALDAGDLSCRQATAIVDQCRFLHRAEQARFEADLLARAPGRTDAQFTRDAVRLRENLHPETLIPRHRKALEARTVWLEARPDGMAELGAYLPAEQGQLIYGALTTAARGEQAAGDPRTIGQLRTDILASLLTGGAGDGSTPVVSGPHTGKAAPGETGAESSSQERSGTSASEPGRPVSEAPAGPGSRTEIMVLVNADTLLGLDDAPAELTGYGLISAETARRLAENTSYLTGLVQDQATGEILGVGTRRKVPPGLRRWLQARDGTCRFPGCDTPAAGHTTTEIDHTLPWAHGGRTDTTNLAHLCRKHHRFKTLGHWKAHQSTSGATAGILEWTSPLGRTYHTEPRLHLRVTGHEPPGHRPEPLVHETQPPF